MPRYKLVALTKPVEGREAEFHDWYQNVHLPEICALAGVSAAQRYQLATALDGTYDSPWLALYDIEVDDPMIFLQAIGEAAVAGKLTLSDASDSAASNTALFTEYGERVLSPK